MLNRILFEIDFLIEIIQYRPHIWIVPCVWFCFCMMAFSFLTMLKMQQDPTGLFFPLIEKFMNKKLNYLFYFSIISTGSIFLALYLKQRKHLY